MAVLQIFAGKKTGVKKGTVTGFGYGSTPSGLKPYFSDETFIATDAGIEIGSTVKNLTDGNEAEVVYVEGYNIFVSNENLNTLDVVYEVGVNDGFSDTEYTELDLFKDETIELTQNIKDFKDVSKVLTDYTQSFKVPASKVNNRYFEHYYNQDIVDGFDARFRYDCILKLNGIDWKEGQIRLTNVAMKDGYADNYEITFYGNIVSLNDILSDDTLDSLPYLDAFNHTVSLTEVRDFFSLGAKLDYDADSYPTGYTMNTVPPGYLNPVQFELGDIIYSFISADNRYFVDTSDGTPDIDGNRNLYVPSGQEDAYHGLLYTDLKPSIKIIHFIRAIEWKYGIKFSDDFIDENNIFFQTVYMQCGAESGSLSKLVSEDSAEFKTSDLVYSSGTELRKGGSLDYFEVSATNVGGGKRERYNILYDTEIDVTGSGAYTVVLYDFDTNKEYYREDVQSGNFSFSYEFSSYTLGTEQVRPSVKVITNGGITQYQLINTTVESVFVDRNGGRTTEATCDYTTTRFTSISQGIGFRSNLVPRMKCIDFLKSLFKMDNLVGYVEQGEIVIKPLNDYYDEGEIFDITEYVDADSYNISRSDIFSEIKYSFTEPKTVFRIKSDELSRDEFGNESFSSNETTSFDGGTYDIKLNFGKMVYEKFFDVDNGEYTGGRWGYSVTESYSPTVEPNLIHSVKMDAFWANNKANGQTNYKYKITDGTSYLDLNGFQNVYHGARNFFEDDVSTGTFSLNFGDEAYNNTDINENSLFRRYHERYITQIYSKQARRVAVDAYLPLVLVLNIKTNSIIIINDNQYRVNSIKNNLTTGKSKLELLSE